MGFNSLSFTLFVCVTRITYEKESLLKKSFGLHEQYMHAHRNNLQTVGFYM